MRIFSPGFFSSAARRGFDGKNARQRQTQTIVTCQRLVRLMNSPWIPSRELSREMSENHPGTVSLRNDSNSLGGLDITDKLEFVFNRIVSHGSLRSLHFLFYFGNDKKRTRCLQYVFDRRCKCI